MWWGRRYVRNSHRTPTTGKGPFHLHVHVHPFHVIQTKEIHLPSKGEGSSPSRRGCACVRPTSRPKDERIYEEVSTLRPTQKGGWWWRGR